MPSTQISGVRFLHRVLWLVVDQNIAEARAGNGGSFSKELVAMVFAFHTLESYLNYVGTKLEPVIWADERNFFRKTPYRGFQGKMTKVLETTSVDKSSLEPRLLETVDQLKSLRDRIAHANTETWERTTRHAYGNEPEIILPALDGRVTLENANRAFTDIEDLIELIQRAAAVSSDDPEFQEAALCENLAQGFGVSNTAPGN
jgi:hypothetical protein